MPEDMIEKVEEVAEIARLGLEEEEKEGLAQDFESILDWFSELDEIDTENVEPAFHPIEVKNEMREDDIEESLDQEEALDLTEHKEDGYFKGPSVR